MYKIYIDDELVYTSRLSQTGLTSAKISLEVNTENNFEYSAVVGSPIYDKARMLKSIVKVMWDDEIIFTGRPVKETIDFYNTKTVTCEGALAYLYDSIQRPKKYTGQPIDSIFKSLIEEHNGQVEDYKQFHVGTVTVVDTTDESIYSGKTPEEEDPFYMYQYDSTDSTGTSSELRTNYENTWDALNNLLLGNLNGYLHLRYESDGMYLDYLNKYLDSEGQIIAFGGNMLDYSKDTDYADICTGVLPLGGNEDEDTSSDDPDDPNSSYYTYQKTTDTDDDKRITISDVNGGSDVYWDSTAVANYGKIVKAVEWSTVKDKNTLLEKAKNYLAVTQFDNMTLEGKVVDFKFLDSNATPLHFLHMVRVISKPHGMDRLFPISRIEMDLLNPANDTVTLGGKMNSMTGAMAGEKMTLNNTRQTVNDISRTVNNNAEASWSNVTKANDYISLEVGERKKDKSEYDSKFEVMAEQIASEVKKQDDKHEELSTTVTQTAEALRLDIKKASEVATNYIIADDTGLKVNKDDDNYTHMGSGDYSIVKDGEVVFTVNADKVDLSRYFHITQSPNHANVTILSTYMGTETAIRDFEILANNIYFYSEGGTFDNVYIGPPSSAHKIATQDWVRGMLKTTNIEAETTPAQNKENVIQFKSGPKAVTANWVNKKLEDYQKK